MSVVRRGAGSGGRTAGRRNPLCGRFKPRPARLAARRFGGGTSTGDDGADRQTPRAERRSLFGGSWCYQSHALSHFAHGAMGWPESPAFRAPFVLKGIKRRLWTTAYPAPQRTGAAELCLDDAFFYAVVRANARTHTPRPFSEVRLYGKPTNDCDYGPPLSRERPAGIEEFSSADRSRDPRTGSRQSCHR
ncbi:hypothetical protein DFP91_1859 [Pseudorhodoplanes sinuspersici]|nr:hypothetical protein DFP91_1859 [Pseudorhodoplanes sinuspersici]